MSSTLGPLSEWLEHNLFSWHCGRHFRKFEKGRHQEERIDPTQGVPLFKVVQQNDLQNGHRVITLQGWQIDFKALMKVDLVFWVI